jgi:hypothetical protein
VTEPRHPIQPLYRDLHGTIRFRQNDIVRFLLDQGPFDLNALATMPFTDADHEQLAMLIGYSLSGFGELSYVSNVTYERAEAAARWLNDPETTEGPEAPD